LAFEEARRLKELDVTKSRLYTNMTHEFRTPLTVILGMADKISEAPGEWLSAGLPAIERSGRQLLRLIDQMLELARLEAGNIPVEYQQGNIIPLLRALVYSSRSYAETRDIDLRFESQLTTLSMDLVPRALADILNNLLSNAFKYTPEGGEVCVRVSQQQTRLAIEVQDNGQGIPAAQLPHVFDRFYQADSSRRRSHDGAGIGLALVKEWINRLQGDIQVQSVEGAGTTFSFSLPITRQAPLAEALILAPLLPTGEAEPSFPLQGPADTTLPLALIIEDHEDVARYIASCLQSRFRLEFAANGKLGIEAAQQNVPDLIICDVMMPELDGYAVCQQLKADERSSHIPLVMLTARADQASRLQGLRRGADAYLTKPFHPEELDLQVANLMHLRTQLQRHYAHFPQLPPAEEAYPQEDAFLGRLKALIEAHLSEEAFGIPQVCTELGISRTQLHRKLKALTGRKTSHVIRSIRLAHARTMLLTTELNISEIAYEVGFSTPSYFSAVFVEEFSMSPSDLRRQSLLS
jgi:CheY-like chemotaxis protein